jgi:hypothetical protein
VTKSLAGVPEPTAPWRLWACFIDPLAAGQPGLANARWIQGVFWGQPVEETKKSRKFRRFGLALIEIP